MNLWRWHRAPQVSPDAQASGTQARRALIDAKNLASRVNKVTDDLAATNERNHFAEAVERSIRRTPPA